MKKSFLTISIVLLIILSLFNTSVLGSNNEISQSINKNTENKTEHASCGGGGGSARSCQYVNCNIDLAKSTLLPFDYDDCYFLDTSGYDFNLDLARITLTLELSAFTASGSKTAEQRYANIKSAYDIIDVDDVTFVNYDKPLSDNNDKCAYSIANKELSDGSELLIVVVRGGGYGGEWASNFRIGEGNYHIGFKTPADDIYSKLETIISEKSIDTSKAKIWVTGYSRGAAIGNLLSGMINENSLIAPENLYSYLFAVPSGVEIEATNAKSELHNNIFNIVSPYDLVPRVVMESWGYGRYGKDMYFKNRNPYGLYDNEVYFYILTDYYYSLAKAHTVAGKSATEALADIVGSKEDYVSKYQSFFCDLAEAVMCHGNDINGFVTNRYESNPKYASARKAAENKCNQLIETAIYYGQFEEADLDTDAIWKYIYPIFTIAYIDGVNQYASDVLTNKLGSVIELILQLENVGATLDAHNSEYYIAWLNGYCDKKDIFEMSNYKAITATNANLNVYDNEDNLLASYVNGYVEQNDIPIDVIGDAVKVYLPINADVTEYKVQLSALADGIVDYSVIEYENYAQTRQVNYSDIAVNTGDTITGYVSTDLDCYSYNYDLTKGVDEIPCTDDLYGYYLDYLTVNIEVEGGGSVSKIDYLTNGEIATLSAYPTKTSNFLGWYDTNDTLVCEYQDYQFVAKDNVSLVAKFSEKEFGIDTDFISLSTDGSLNISANVIYKEGTEGAFYVGIYNEDGKLLACKKYTLPTNKNELLINEVLEISAYKTAPYMLKYFLIDKDLAPLVEANTGYVIYLEN